MRKPSPAAAIAFTALLVALGGTALAARQYVVTSINQLKPSVLTQLAATGPYSYAPSKMVALPPGHYGEAQATCRPGFHLVSGGYTGEVGPGARIIGDAPTVNGWVILVDDTHAQEASKIEVRALCTAGQLKTYPPR